MAVGSLVVTVDSLVVTVGSLVVAVGSLVVAVWEEKGLTEDGWMASPTQWTYV